ncbi:MAG: rRNA maturation RNase YbeY [Elusimicrobia bacterium]|nr:rRNA maturation RNase YbeY [Elusimicrobiota bacterium]
MKKPKNDPTTCLWRYKRHHKIQKLRYAEQTGGRVKISLFFKTPIPVGIKSKIKILKKISEEALKSVRNKNSETSIIFVNAAQIKKINKKFLKKISVTDVIAFNYPKEIKIKEPLSFGDVFVCVDQAKKQAELLQHSLLKELAILAVHGCLHLKGMGDGTKAEKAAMDKKTEFYIKRYFKG